MTENRISDITTSAAALCDGGWRAEDRDRLITEYDLTAEDADAICQILQDIREKALEEFIRDAGSLYDGGWRAEDHDQLMSEYDLTSDEADAICEALRDIEEANASSEDDE